MKDNYQTTRLSLSSLNPADAAFILELVNTPEWVRFIGERNVKTEEDAVAYIQRIMQNPDIMYWVVRLKEQQEPIGIITFIKRDYLEHHDIGFAFLARYGKQGFAYEATAAVLADVAQNTEHTHILATTVEDNVNSIKLLQKLGLQFEKQIQNGNDTLLVFGAPTHALLPSNVVS